MQPVEEAGGGRAIRTALGCDITEPPPHIGVMRLRPQLLVWAWLAARGAIETAPRRKRAMAPALRTKSPRFLDRPDFFDYPDSDKASLLAVAQFIGEKPVVFINSGMNQLEKGPPSLLVPGGEQPRTYPLGHQKGVKGLACLAGSSPGLFHHILVGFLVVVFFFLLFQFCTHIPSPPPLPFLAPKNLVTRALVAFMFTQIVFY
ncbi:hypothetical protein AAY473_013913 [Plecturocebus cupreus]